MATTVIPQGGGSDHQRKPGFGAWLCLAPMLGWLILFVVVPAVLLVIMSFAERGTLGRVVYNFSFDNYVRLFGSWPILKIFLISIWYAFLTTVICVVVGYPVGYFIGRLPERWRNLGLTLVMIPFWTSFLIRTYAWVSLLSKEGLINGTLMSAQLIPAPIAMMYTPFAVVLGLVYNFLPFMILPIYTSAERLDGAMIEAAYDLGAGPVRAFSQVIIPLTQPGIAAGALLVFVPAIGMFAITTLMGGGTNPTIGEVIYNQFVKVGDKPYGAAIGTVLMALFLLTMWLMRLTRKET